MNPFLRAYHSTHDPAHALTQALDALHATGVLGENGTLPADPEALEQLARNLHLPVAAVRGALSSYSELHAGLAGEAAAIRVCAGTSCMLAGGADVHRELGARHPCRGVYCLGYCDRAPVVMTTSGHVVPAVTRDQFDAVISDLRPAPPVSPSIRCSAREPIVTRRLLGPTPPGLPEWSGLGAALAMSPDAVTGLVLESNLRGRGGAAYPTGRKWRLAAQATGSPKFVVANGDEGDPGSFIDRELMERDPHGILEGMAICAHAIGASRGIVFIRAEYPLAAERMERAIALAGAHGLLGPEALGPGRPFRVEVVRGLGSYVCGEETALLSAIEGDRGEVRPRPPYPVEQGLFGKPTVVDNVETLVNVPWLMVHGAAAYRAMGTKESSGTKAICFSSGFARPGIVEIEFGMSLRHAIDSLGRGGARGAALEAVLLGGPMGSIITPEAWDTPICFSAMSARHINLGHGGLVAIRAPADWRAILRHLLDFMRDESCGKCVPCRVGSTRAHELVHAGLDATNRPAFERILDVMSEASLCAFGRETTGPVRTILERFGPEVLR